MAVDVARALVATSAAALLLTGCGLGDKESWSDAIVDATEAAFAADTVTGTLEVSDRILELPAGLGSIGGVALGGAGDSADPMEALRAAQEQAEAQGVRGIVTDVALDLRADRASVTVPGRDKPFVVFDGMDAYGRRYDAGERDARPWVRVELDDVDEGGGTLSPLEDPPILGAYSLSPVTLLDLMAGPLTGSIELVGAEDIDGVAVTRYDANFDIDKVLRDTRRKRWPEARREALEDLFDTLAVRGTTHEGSVWIDQDGLPRRFTLRLEEEPVRNLRVEIVLQLDLLAFGPDVALHVPTPQERIDVGNVVQLLRSAIPSPRDPAAFGEFLGIEIPTGIPGLPGMPVPAAAPPAAGAPAPAGASTTTTTAAPG